MKRRIVVLDDYEQSLRKTADWSAVDALADVEVHSGKLRGDALFEAIKDAEAIVVVRDRTPFKADLIAKLPKLKLFVFTGARNTQLDTAVMAARGIPVGHTGMGESKASNAEITRAPLPAPTQRRGSDIAAGRAGRSLDAGALRPLL